MIRPIRHGAARPWRMGFGPGKDHAYKADHLHRLAQIETSWRLPTCGFGYGINGGKAVSKGAR